MVLLEKREVEQLRLLAELAYPEEFCAILLGKQEAEGARITRVMPTPNTHDTPRRAYTIAPAAVITAQRKSREEELRILGFAHSHPDHPAKPSASDLEQALWLGCIYGIVSVSAGIFDSIAFYRLEGNTLDDRAFAWDAHTILNSKRH